MALWAVRNSGLVYQPQIGRDLQLTNRLQIIYHIQVVAGSRFQYGSLYRSDRFESWVFDMITSYGNEGVGIQIKASSRTNEICVSNQ